MTLAWSRHAYAEIVTDQKVATWLGCHSRAFEWYYVPGRLTIDNPKYAITRAWYRGRKGSPQKTAKWSIPAGRWLSNGTQPPIQIRRTA